MLRLTYLPFLYFLGIVRHLVAVTYRGLVAGILFVLVAMPTTCWRVLPVLKLAAFKLLAPLKPVYRESYRTHGLSLQSGHPA